VTVGQEIRRLREERGWSQAKLGVLSGTGPSGISQIETGRRNPSAATLQRIAEALGVGIADLFPKGQAPLPDFEVERRESDMLPTMEPVYTAFEALGQVLAGCWEADLEEWNEKFPDGTVGDAFVFARLLQWSLEVGKTVRLYKAVLGEPGSPRRPEAADTLRKLEEADRKARDKVVRAFEPVKTHVEFKKIWEASNMEALVSGAGSR
jgi:transcriptional regulator with XRE-family HTH domain